MHDIDAVDVYQQQLIELEARDGPADATATERAEIARRILKLKRQERDLEIDPVSGFNAAKWASIVSLTILPALALGTYFYTGSPHIADQPLSAAKAEKIEDKSIEEMVIIAERHLAKNPNDQKGWEVLAGVYGRLNRAGDKARALQELIRLAGPSPNTLADLGEALTVAGGNIVPSRAREMFEQALAENPGQSKASFYLAIALEQEGRFKEAIDRYNALGNLQKANPQWQSMIKSRIAALQLKMDPSSRSASQLPGPTSEDVANAAGLSSKDRLTMIEGMVSNLASKLSEEPNDVDGWIRLIRSYAVLKKSKEATKALTSARKQFELQPVKLAAVNTLAAQLNLRESEIKP